MDTKNLELPHNDDLSAMEILKMGSNASIFGYCDTRNEIEKDSVQHISTPIVSISESDRLKFKNFDIDSALEDARLQSDEVKVDVDDVDNFQAFENWLVSNGAQFPDLCLQSYSCSDVRGVHAKSFIDGYRTILSIPLRLLITDHMGRTETDLGRRLFRSNASLSTPNLIAVIVYILTTRRDPSHFFQPYYRILPKSYSNFPIFWSEQKLSWLKGSPLLHDIEERKRSMRSDYDEICRACPDFSEFSFDEFLEIRTAVGSRNFGIVVNGEKRTAMVPYADMLNHYRPRETSWTYETSKGAFTITSISAIERGQQVMDSYGKKCNSKFFLHYGFAVERNREEDGRCQNEILLNFEMENSVRSLLNNRSEEVDASSDLIEKKMILLSSLFNLAVHRGRALKKGFRVSMNFEDKATAEALSFLRVKAASENDITSIINEQRNSPRHLPDLYFSRSREVSVYPVSLANEARALKILSEKCRIQLQNYESDYNQNLTLLNSGDTKPFSDRRTALVVVLGEQETCEFWIYAAQIICPILEGNYPSINAVAAALSTLPSEADRERDLLRYSTYLADRFSKLLLEPLREKSSR